MASKSFKNHFAMKRQKNLEWFCVMVCFVAENSINDFSRFVSSQKIKLP